MEYANRNNQNASKINQQITSGKGKPTLVDNRTDFTSQAKLIDTIQRSRNGESTHVIQRVPIGSRGARIKWCKSCDDDRGRIHIRDVGGIGDTHACQDADGRTRIGQQPAPDVEDENPILKHYMVVKNGTTYQLPVKHFYQPGYVGGDLHWIPNDAQNHLHRAPNDHRENPPTEAATYKGRSNQPEGFGGNQDWDDELIRDGQINVFASRNATLWDEYQEESGRALAADATIASSKYYTSQWSVGTMSIISTNQILDAVGFTSSPPGNVLSRGLAEMAGTITIDCSDLLGKVRIGDRQKTTEWLEQEIGGKIIERRNALLEAIGVNTRRMSSPFWRKAGILSHLVTMIAEDLIEEKQAQQAGRQRVFEPLTPVVAADGT